MGDSDFTVKEIVLEIKETLTQHIEKTDTRLDNLEGDSKTMKGVLRFTGWLIGSSGLITGLIFIVKNFIK